MSNRKNVQKKTTAFGEPSSEPTKTRASANVAVQPTKRNSSAQKNCVKLEVKADPKPNKPTKSKKQTETVTKDKLVVGLANPRRGEIPKILYENYQSPPFNRFYILAFAMGILMAVAGYSGWQYTTAKVGEKIEGVAESPRVHSWINKVTNKRSPKVVQIKNSKVKKTKHINSRRKRR